ncbi:MAG: hypothetical protein RSB51_05550 [Clostridia bacterium]
MGNINTKKIIIKILNSKIIIGVLAYLFMGAAVFASYNVNLSYLLVIKNTLMSPIYVCMFIFPAYMLVANYVAVYILNKESYILKLGSRKKYCIFQYIISIAVTSVVYISNLCIICIAANITKNTGIEHVGNEFKEILLGIFRIYACILVFLSLNIYIRNTFKNNIFFSAINMCIIVCIFFSLRLDLIDFSKNLIPAYHIFNMENSNKYIELAIKSSIYYASIFTLLMFLNIKAVNKLDIYKDRN